VVRQSAEFLAEAVEHYTFISSLSVYTDNSQLGIDEQGAVGKLADETVEEITGESYGPLKALCEQVVEQTLPGRALVIRPGLIVGPYDRTDRFTYWPVRVAQGGPVLAPGRPARVIEFIDVRDLAEWTVRMVEGQRIGIYNADGPAPQPSMEGLLETCRTVSGSDATFVWVSEAFLAEQQVEPWMEMPLWVPESDPTMAGFFAFDNRKAVAAGLTFRPLAETVQATLDWAATWPPDYQMRAGISREKEAALLAAWGQK
jgi:2'-hydroxyisoflavone reductase